jgi:four helix bundle protein
MVSSYKSLDSWKVAIKLSVFIYEITKTFPKEEMYGIISQIRRAVVSISNNIAEGTGVRYKGRFIYHLRIAIGSTNEVENLSIIALKLDYISNDDYVIIEKDLENIRKLTFGLIRSLKQNSG